MFHHSNLLKNTTWNKCPRTEKLISSVKDTTTAWPLLILIQAALCSLTLLMPKLFRHSEQPLPSTIRQQNYNVACDPSGLNLSCFFSEFSSLKGIFWNFSGLFLFYTHWSCIVVYRFNFHIHLYLHTGQTSSAFFLLETNPHPHPVHKSTDQSNLT